MCNFMNEEPTPAPPRRGIRPRRRRSFPSWEGQGWVNTPVSQEHFDQNSSVRVIEHYANSAAISLPFMRSVTVFTGEQNA